MLLAAGCSYVLLGHSERRQFCGEDDSLVNRKLTCALQAGLCPIVCVGETLQEREADRIEEVVLGQVGGALTGIEASAARAVLWAYEPVWAIGTGVTATAAQADEVHAMMRHFLAGTLGKSSRRRGVHPVRRQRQARKRSRTLCPRQHRRGLDRRCRAGRRAVCRYCEGRPLTLNLSLSLVTNLETITRLCLRFYLRFFTC